MIVNYKNSGRCKMNNNYKINEIFKLQQDNKSIINNTSSCTRIKKLKKLLESILENKKEIENALKSDLHKSEIEVMQTEIFPTVSEIRYNIRKLKKWMKPKKVNPSLVFMFSKNKIVFRPKGVSLIISPWNVPFLLTLSPLIAAISAGNCVIVKPSEHSPYTTNIIKKIISKVFSINEVAVVEGDSTISQHLLKLSFDHIFFTGSPAVGKIVMNAASNNLIPVTLELGGKSPVIVDSSTNLEIAAKKIVWGKLLNCGQICVAPDYILVQENILEKFIEYLKKYIIKQFGDSNKIKSSTIYGRIINKNNFIRLQKLFEDAINKNSKLEFGGIFDEENNYISPTIISNISLNSNIMNEEIFGPLLPILTFNKIDDAISLINSKPNPLVIYIFSKINENINKVLKETTSGSFLINDVISNIANIKLPFGGVKNSGIGRTHGYYGFRAFSNETAIMKQPIRSLTELLYPPYTKIVKFLSEILVRFF